MPVRSRFPSYRVLGVRIDAVQVPEAVRAMREWALDRSRPRFVAVTPVQNVVEAQRDPGYRACLEQADLCVADGFPIMVLGRLAGHPMRRRVYGPELMLRFLEAAPELRHFLYGGLPGVAERLAEALERRIPGFRIAGSFGPPVGPVPPREPADSALALERARPDVVWVGLGTPKQERWMAARREELGIPLLVGVGAAFDFLSGRVAQAPRWMREAGFEWLFRLAVEPRRLWRRYLLGGGEFVLRILAAGATGGIETRGRA